MVKKVKGKVIRGRGRGRRQGYPTALLDVPWEGETGVFGAKVRVLDPLTPTPVSSTGQDLSPPATPALAWRAGLKRWSGSWLPAIFIVGVEPGLPAEMRVPLNRSEAEACEAPGKAGPSVELYILDFDEDLYGKTIEVEVREKLRDILRFAREDELKKKIEEDISLVRRNFPISNI